MAIPNFWQKYARAIYALVFGSSDDWFKYSSFVFPKQTKCDFHNYGVSGGMQSKDSLCLMPLNNINDKIFVVIWIWYIVLLTATLLNGIYVVLLFTNRKLRMEVLKRQALMHISNKQICSATNDEHLGDCFVLKQMASNLNPLVFIEIMEDLSLERSIKLNDYWFKTAITGKCVVFSRTNQNEHSTAIDTCIILIFNGGNRALQLPRTHSFVKRLSIEYPSHLLAFLDFFVKKSN